MNDKQRAEFEKWFKENHTQNVQKVNGEYVHGATERLWQSWQAAIASVVVELPELEGVDGECENFNNGFYAGYQDCMGDIKKSIELAGIRYE